MTDFSNLIGKTLADVNVNRDAGDDRVTLTTVDGRRYVQFHSQDCCEGVEIVDICGDLSDLIGSPVLIAEEAVSENVDPEGAPDPGGRDDSFTWTFYKLATIKGAVTIRWFGTSNGYYSESVDFEEVA